MSLVGNLEDLGLGEILQIVSLSRKSGSLALHSRGGREGRVEFRLGQVIRGRSTTYQQGLGEVLVQKELISQQDLKLALDRQEQEGFKERLGTILVKHFSIPEATIEAVVREQIENIVYSLFAWKDGTFEFELQEAVEAADDIRMDPLQFMLNQGLNPQFLAMEGSRIIDEQRHRGESPDDEVSPEESAAAQDANVDFAFDLLQEPAETAPASKPVAAPLPITEKSRQRQLVLVDDDAATRLALVSLLEKDGYTVFPFERSEETLVQVDTMYRQGQHPTVLVDLIMPRMDGSGILGGVELLELLRNNFPAMPVLVLADFPNVDAERKVKAMGYAFMMKPRKSDIIDAAVLAPFSGAILEKLARVEAGEGAVAWTEKVNIGAELRHEMGEDQLKPDSDEHAVQSTGISLLRGMLEELNDPALGGGIILLVLRFASEFMNRAVIFIVKRDEIVGLGQFGTDVGAGVDDARVRSMRIPRDGASFFSKVIESQLPVRMAPEDSKWNSYLFEQLGGEVPNEIFLGPIISEGKVVAVLYGDNLPDKQPIDDTDALEIFLSQAGIAMEKALLQRRLQEKRQEVT